MADNDLRATIEAAFSAAEGQAGDAVSPDAGVAGEAGAGQEVGAGGSQNVARGGQEVAAVAAPPGETRAPAEPARDQSGRFAKDADAAQVKAKPKQGGEVAAPAAPGGDTPSAAGAAPVPVPVAPTRKAPQSWTPAEREHFAKAAPEVQAAVERVDREVRQVMQEAAPARKFHQEYVQAMAPFDGMFRRAGLDPIRAAQSAFTTISQLQQGTPESRAQVFANLMRAYPTSVEALAAHIDGQPQAAAQPGQQAAVDPDALLRRAKQEMRQEFMQERQERAGTVVRATLEKFATNPDNEFFEDVWEDVARLVNDKHPAGVEAAVTEAYARACWANPDVRAILQQRELAKSSSTAQAATQRASAAGSSVRNQPASPVNGARPGDLRSDINAAISKLNGGR